MPQSAHNTAHAALVDLMANILPVWIRHLASSRTQAEEAVSEMISAFSEISPRLGVASTSDSRESKSTATLIEQMYVGFQYEDRINQMLSLLLEDMQRLQTAIGHVDHQSLDDLAPSRWLARLESQYAMAEQRQVHAGDATVNQSHGNTTANGADGNTDFF